MENYRSVELQLHFEDILTTKSFISKKKKKTPIRPGMTLKINILCQANILSNDNDKTTASYVADTTRLWKQRQDEDLVSNNGVADVYMLYEPNRRTTLRRRAMSEEEFSSRTLNLNVDRN